MVDDGSSDGTADIVREKFPWVSVLPGSGNLFWCRGMHMAMTHVARYIQPGDYVLWINDDTCVYPDAVRHLMETGGWIRQHYRREGIVVGTTCDQETGLWTYGGCTALDRWRPFKYSAVHSMTMPLPCDTMNGNMVLIPYAVIAALGPIDNNFEHAMGDTDYGLRATKRGYPVVVCPGFVGTCSINSISGTFKDRNIGVRRRMSDILSRKGLPWRSWLIFTRRHGGPEWPIQFIWPYLRILTSRPWFDSSV